MADEVSLQQRIGARAAAPEESGADGSSVESVARRRLRGIRPLTAGKVLSHPRYWTFPFLRLYLEECDERAFYEPEAGYHLGHPAPELARRIGVGDGPELFTTEAQKVAWRVRALVVWGSCCRAYGELSQAEAAYEQARELCATSPVDPATRGEIAARFAVLCLARGRFDQALEQVNEGLELFNEGGDLQRVADSFVIRGSIRLIRRDVGALPDLMRALSTPVDTGWRGERTWISAVSNMAQCIVDGLSLPEHYQVAGILVHQLRSRLAKKPKSLFKLLLLRVEGLVLARLGMTRLARKKLRRARAGLQMLHDPVWFIVTSVDLLALLLEEDDLAEAEMLVAETRQILQGIATPADQLSGIFKAWFEHWPTQALSAHVANLRAELAAQLGARPGGLRRPSGGQVAPRKVAVSAVVSDG